MRWNCGVICSPQNQHLSLSPNSYPSQRCSKHPRISNLSGKKSADRGIDGHQGICGRGAHATPSDLGAVFVREIQVMINVKGSGQEGRLHTNKQGTPFVNLVVYNRSPGGTE